MNQPIHFATWLTVPGSDEENIQLCAFGTSPAIIYEVSEESRVIRTEFRPKPRRWNFKLPPLCLWPNRRKLYNAKVLFQDGSVVTLPPLDMSKVEFTGGATTDREHRSHTNLSGLQIKSPIVATTPFGNALYDLWVDSCVFSAGALDKIDNWFPGWRRVYVTNCTFDTCMSGPQGNNVEMVRNAYLYNIGGDALSDARIVWGAEVVGHVKGRADLHPDSYQFRSRGPTSDFKLLAGITDHSNGSQGIFADRSTAVRNAVIASCDIRTDGVGAALSLEHSTENVLIENCTFRGPTRIEQRTNVVIRNTPGVS